jgi:hypothetical protein
VIAPLREHELPWLRSILIVFGVIGALLVLLLMLGATGISPLIWTIL